MFDAERKWLKAREEEYRRLDKKFKDPKTIKGMILGILDHMESALSFNFAEQTDAEAFAVIAKQQCEFSGLLTQMSLIEEYESRVDELNGLEAQIEGLESGELNAADLFSEDFI